MAGGGGQPPAPLLCTRGEMGAEPLRPPTPKGVPMLQLTVVSPGHEHVLQAAVGLVHPALRAGGAGVWARGCAMGLGPPPETPHTQRGRGCAHL